MAEIAGIITLDTFVKDLLFKLEKNDDDYLRYFKISVDGLRHLLMHKLGYVTHTKLVLDTDTNTIDFPNDYVGFVSLSVPDNGRMWTLTRDDRIVPTTSTDGNGDEYLDEDAGETVDLGEEANYSGYGARGGINDWYYSIDHKNRRIIINGLEADFFILTYISSGINASSATYIPLYVQEPLEDYVRWQDAKYKDAQDQDYKKKLFEESQRRMIKLNAPTFSEIKDALYRSANQSIHR